MGTAQFAIVQVGDLPIGLDVLVRESEAEGFNFLQRLVADWESGANRFSRPGEALFVAMRGEQVLASTRPDNERSGRSTKTPIELVALATTFSGGPKGRMVKLPLLATGPHVLLVIEIGPDVVPGEKGENVSFTAMRPRVASP